MSYALQVPLICFRKILMSLEAGRVRINTRARRSTSLDAEDSQRWIYGKGFFMILVKFFIVPPLLRPFSGDVLNSEFAFALSFIWRSLQLLIKGRRQICSSILPFESHLLFQRRKLRN